MLTFLAAHAADLLVLALLALGCFFVLRGMLRRRKSGGCGCGCEGCGKPCPWDQRGKPRR